MTDHNRLAYREHTAEYIDRNGKLRHFTWAATVACTCGLIMGTAPHHGARRVADEHFATFYDTRRKE